MPDYDVFVSYAHADAAAVAPLVAALRDRGLAVWQDASDMAPFESITGRIVEGLGRSKAMLAWYTATYPTRRACQWELTAGFLAAQHEGDPRRRVLVVNPEDGAGHIHPVELRDQFFVAPGDLDAIGDVAGRIADHVAGLGGRLGAIRALEPPRWHGAVASATATFVGREAEMWRLHSALSGPDAAIITGQAPAASLAQVAGLGGVGKSMLASEYALRYGAAYPGGVFWLRAYGNDDTKATLDAAAREGERQSQMLSFAAGLGLATEGLPPEQVDAAIWAGLDRRGERCLWVVDDLPSDLDEVGVKAWACRSSAVRTLYTTRSRQYRELARSVDLGVLDPEAGFELLTSRRRPDGDDEDAAARGIVTDLGAHALALAVCAGVLEKQAGLQSFAGYRAALADPAAQALELAEELADVLPTGHAPGIAQTMLHSIERIGAEGLDFLLLASVLAPAPIPAAVVAAVLAEAGGLDESEATVVAARGIGQATDRSLADAEGESRVVHTLVSRAVQAVEGLGDRRQELREAGVTVVGRQMPSAADVRRHAALEPLLPHARELARPLATPSEAELLGWLARFDFERGAYALARRDYEQQLAAHRRLLGDDHPSTLTSVSNLAQVLRAQGDLPAARQLTEDVLAAHRRLLGDDHPHTLASMGNLAQILQAQGDLLAARQLTDDVLAARRRLLGDEHPDTLTSMNNLAQVLHAQGDLEAARQLAEDVLAARRRLLGDDHPDTLTSMNNLAQVLQAQGDLESARQLTEQELAICRRVLGDEHPDTLIAMNNLVQVLHAQGDLEAARQLADDVLAAHRRLLGDDHPHTLIAMNNLAQILQAQGDLPAARQLTDDALAAHRRLFGDDHPHTLIAENNLAQILQAQGDLEAARQLAEDVLAAFRRVLGDGHPNTGMAARNLLGLLVEMEDSEAAVALLGELPEVFPELFDEPG